MSTDVTIVKYKTNIVMPNFWMFSRLDVGKDAVAYENVSLAQTCLSPDSKSC